MTVHTKPGSSNPSPLQTYIIKGGAEGRARLGVLSRALAPSTCALLDRIGPIDGAKVVDAASGGGDVTLELARRVGPSGRVTGLDFDEVKLAQARTEARDGDFHNVAYLHSDVTKAWPVAGADIVYARFILTHLKEPEALIDNAWKALVPGGFLIVEDIDAQGNFCYPPSPAHDKLREFYVKTCQHNGGDPFIGRRLDLMLEKAGFEAVKSTMVQPYGREGDTKMIVPLTFAAIEDSVIAAGLASRDEFAALYDAVAAFAADKGTTVSMPRVFQAWGRKP